ncbi:tyrosine-type recombinase/integrase [Noviherbaspirillum pedocola]|uniref:Tyrosine-type recombinase/integrase n=1 Tax=Noviherbaspirillum pedocola TaxID=2801341 RepID=A0A934SPQ0_9BURK|nr:tyrosine-type recombinase/integrase [Noviherbaspirillum pedocola]MBK4733038.1 tyrosine-type recombinase/integrase [Noviherbaspirillum pedocola]
MANFKTKSDVAKMIPPAFKGDYWSSSQEGFGIRIGGRKKDGSFQKEYLARWRDEHGKDQRPTIGRYDEIDFAAASDIARQRVAFEKKRVSDIKKGIAPSLTMNEAYQRFILENKVGWSKITVVGYDSRWKNVEKFHNRPMEEITNWEWFDLYAELVEKNGPIAALAAHSLARNVYSYFIKENLIETNPCEDLERLARKKERIVQKPKKRERHVSLELMPDYYQALMTRAGPAQRDYILFGLLTGFRASLLGSLAWARLDMRRHTYHVEAVDIGNKSKIAFDYPICDFLWERVIVPRLEIREPGAEWILESPQYPGYPLCSVRGTHEKLEKHAGIKLSDHDLRKTFGSIAYAATKDLLTVQRLLTHSQAPKNRETEITELYVRTSERTFREAVEATARQFVMYTKRETAGTGFLPEATLDYEEKKKLEYADQARAEALVAEAEAKQAGLAAQPA